MIIFFNNQFFFTRDYREDMEDELFIAELIARGAIPERERK